MTRGLFKGHKNAGAGNALSNSYSHTDSIRLHTDLPYVKRDGTDINLFYSCQRSFRAKYTIEVHKLATSENEESKLVLYKKNCPAKFKKGVNKIRVNFNTNDSDTYKLSKFEEVLKRTNSVAPGKYSFYIRLHDTSTIYSTSIYYKVDSVIKPGSAIEKDISSCLALAKGKMPTAKTKYLNGGAATTKTEARLKKLARKKGLQVLQHGTAEKKYIDLYYEDWFAGRYELNANEPLSDQLERIHKKGEKKASMNDELGSMSLFSQYQSTSHTDGEDIKGNISIATYNSTGQEQNSNVDNNYQEIKGRTAMEILKVPVQMDGLYTTQDRNRKIKSSYFHVHYDADKAKEELAQSIMGYNKKYAQAKSKGGGLEQMYTGSINSLENQKDALQKEIDNTGNVKLSDKEVADKQQQLNDVNNSIEKYQKLLAQTRNTRYFDSSLVYARTSGIQSCDGLSYKQLQKKAANIMPEGKKNGFMSGLTSADAGMFPENTSKYTMAGQMMKGAKLAYDLKYCEVTASVGKTEYIGRDGSPDKYTCYSGAVLFRPADQHKASVIYYGYSPDKKLYSKDVFFKSPGLYVPNFFNPVHIFATTYDAALTKNIKIGSEVATSLKQGEKNDTGTNALSNRMAYHLEGVGCVPGTSISLEAAYDKSGSEFENSTLPFVLNGTEQYKAGISSDITRYLTAGIQYYHLRQSGFAFKGKSTNWGFDAKTNLKRFPNIYLSYKPFTTFRSYSDTMLIPQRLIFGSVSSGRVSYNIKNKSGTYRFSAQYNKAKSIADTLYTTTELIQALAAYNSKRYTCTINMGQTHSLPVLNDSIDVGHTRFAGISGTWLVTQRLNICAEENIALNKYGISRYSSMLGMVHSFKKFPLSVRLSFRYNKFKPSPLYEWQEILGSVVDVEYRFEKRRVKK